MSIRKIRTRVTRKNHKQREIRIDGFKWPATWLAQFAEINRQQYLEASKNRLNDELEKGIWW